MVRTTEQKLLSAVIYGRRNACPTSSARHDIARQLLAGPGNAVTRESRNRGRLCGKRRLGSKLDDRRPLWNQPRWNLVRRRPLGLDAWPRTRRERGRLSGGERRLSVRRRGGGR